VDGEGSLLSSLPLLAEASEMGVQELQQQDDLQSKRTIIMKERTMSMESAASMYMHFRKKLLPLNPTPTIILILLPLF
jgi:hypothetical protein